MPEWLQYIDFSLGLIGFVITLCTLGTALSVKKQIIQRAEYRAFKQNLPIITGQIQGYIDSINEDAIYSSDSTRNFNASLSQFLIDLRTKFTFLSKASQKTINSVHKKLENPNLTDSDWNAIAEQLISLRNAIGKESQIHG